MDDWFGDYLVATCRALRRLVRTPDLAALGVKIGLVMDEGLAELSGGRGVHEGGEGGCAAALRVVTGLSLSC